MPNDEIQQDGNDKTATPGGLPPEQVDDRTNVGTVAPEDYPKQDRADAAPEGHSKSRR